MQSSGSTQFATHQYSASCYIQSAPDVVYQFTSPESVLVVSTVHASWSEALHVRTNNCATGIPLLCDVGFYSDSSWFVFWVEPNNTYYFIVDGYQNTFLGAYIFTLQESPVQNDVCPGTVVPALPYTDSGSTQFALHQYSASCYFQTGQDVVYQFSSPDSVRVVSTLHASWSDALHVRKNNCATGIPLICDVGFYSESSSFVFWAEPDTTYYFIADAAQTLDAGPYTFTLEDVTPPNDHCPGTIIPALPYTDSGSTANATHQYNGICYTQSAPDLVYQYTSPDLVSVRASMVAPWFDCMHVRRNNCETGASIYCDFGSGPDSSWFDFMAEPDSTYYFFVDGAFNNDYGPYTFTLTNLSCPAPDSLVIATSGNEIVLRWPHVDCDTPLYSIYRNDSLDVQPIPANLIGTTTDSTFTDVGILSGGDLRNFYVVTAE